MGVEPKIGGKPPKRDGENNGKPYQNGWFGGNTIFGNTHIRFLYIFGWFPFGYILPKIQAFDRKEMRVSMQHIPETCWKHAGNMNLIISSSWWDSECAELEHAGTGTFRRLNHVHLKEQNWAAWHNPDISYQYQFYHWVLSFFKVGVVAISSVPFPASTCFWVSLVFS